MCEIELKHTIEELPRIRGLISDFGFRITRPYLVMLFQIVDQAMRVIVCYSLCSSFDQFSAFSYGESEIKS